MKDVLEMSNETCDKYKLLKVAPVPEILFMISYILGCSNISTDQLYGWNCRC